MNKTNNNGQYCMRPHVVSIPYFGVRKPSKHKRDLKEKLFEKNFKIYEKSVDKWGWVW